MVEYRPSDVLAIEDFPLAWRITDERWSAQPTSVLSRIKPLSSEKSHRLYESAPWSALSRGGGAGARASSAFRRSLGDSGSPGGDEGVRNWFRALPIEPDRDVYLCWNQGGGVAAVTDWRTFVDIWSDLWYPFDALAVFDEGRRWAVLFGPDEEVTYLPEMPALP